MLLSLGLQILAVLLFSYGLFPPQKKSLQQKESINGRLPGCGGNSQSVQHLVLLVIDSFRDEFLFEYEAMKWTRERIYQGGAKAFRARTQSPTGTLPRLKVL